jgi:hypothetical protein
VRYAQKFSASNQTHWGELARLGERALGRWRSESCLRWGEFTESLTPLQRLALHYTLDCRANANQSLLECACSVTSKRLSIEASNGWCHIIHMHGLNHHGSPTWSTLPRAMRLGTIDRSSHNRSLLTGCLGFVKDDRSLLIVERPSRVT